MKQGIEQGIDKRNIEIAKNMLKDNDAMTEYEGPIYLRKSEAEEKAGC